MDQINGEMLKAMIVSGANQLSNKRKMVDDLNVFPVPDGDTGTNMNMTFSSAAAALEKSDAQDAQSVAEVVANATIRGARGNSGVILSQLFRGFSRSVKGKEALTAKDFAEALKAGSDTAYKAVMKPTEGTILTVSKDAANAGLAAAEAEVDLVVVLEAIINGAKKSLDHTPQLLPILKQAGVVDAGGMGFFMILEGFLSALKGLPIQKEASDVQEIQVSTPASAIATEDIKFTYCTEFLINTPKKGAKKCKAALERMGDSLVFVEDDDIIKVHIHTNTPGFALQEALKLGELSNIKIDNMKIQHNQIVVEQKKPHQPYAFVAVAAGTGLEQLFRDIGVDEIVHGGQSMNPGTDDILAACNKLDADVIYVLPNNKNIILAAQQAKELTDANIVVLPTKSIPQGIGAVLAFEPGESAEVNEKTMLEAIAAVKTGSVTFASRNTTFGEQKIQIGDILGLEGSELKLVGSDINAVAGDLIQEIGVGSGEIITVFYGEEVKEADAKQFASHLESVYPNCDVVLHYGGQPLYYYIISIE